VVSQLTIVSGGLGSALFPRLAAAKPEEAYALANTSTTTLVAIMTPAVIMALAVIHPFLVLWVGAEFADRTANVGEIILLGIWINCLVVLHATMLHAEGRLRQFVGIYLIEIPLFLLMLWKGIERWGIAGAAAASSIRVAIDATLILWVSGALRQTLQRSVPSMVLMVFAVIISLNAGPMSLFRWLGMMSLLGLSVFFGWKEIVSTARTLLARRAVLY